MKEKIDILLDILNYYIREEIPLNLTSIKIAKFMIDNIYKSNEQFEKLKKEINIVDLKRCKPGDKLRAENGEIYTYIGENDDLTYPHRIQDSNGHIYARNDNGLAVADLACDRDIIEIIKGN